MAWLRLLAILPLGLAAELTRDSSRLRAASEPTLTQRAARLIASYAVDPQLTVGLIAGREYSQYSIIDRQDSIVGARMQWRPNERGELNVSVEDRYFGTGGDLEWRQRSPYFGVSLRANRQPVAQSGSHLLGAAGAVEAIFADPQHPFTLGLMGSVPSLGRRTGRLATIPGTVPPPPVPLPVPRASTVMGW